MFVKKTPSGTGWYIFTRDGTPVPPGEIVLCYRLTYGPMMCRLGLVHNLEGVWEGPFVVEDVRVGLRARALSAGPCECEEGETACARCNAEALVQESSNHPS